MEFILIIRDPDGFYTFKIFDRLNIFDMAEIDHEMSWKNRFLTPRLYDSKGKITDPFDLPPGIYTMEYS